MLAGSLALGVGGDGEAGGAQGMRDVERWIIHVSLPEREKRVAALQEWQPTQLEAVVRILDGARKALEAEGTISVPPLGTMERQALDHLLFRGALVHTEVAQERPWSSIASPDRTVSSFEQLIERDKVAALAMSADGRVTRAAEPTFHWAIARRLLGLMQESDRNDRWRADWYLGVAALLHQDQSFEALRLHLAEAERALGAIPQLAVFRGAAHEHLASPWIQRAATVARSRGLAVGVGSRNSELQAARRAFGRAISADPGGVTAYIRIARVLNELGRHREAAGAIDRALQLSPDSTDEYFAMIVSAEISIVSKDLEGALVSLERARALRPSSDIPSLGITWLSSKLSRPQSVVVWPPRRREATDPDPWWRYYVSHTEAVGVAFLALWKELER